MHLDNTTVQFVWVGGLRSNFSKPNEVEYGMCDGKNWSCQALMKKFNTVAFALEEHYLQISSF